MNPSSAWSTHHQRQPAMAAATHHIIHTASPIANVAYTQYYADSPPRKRAPSAGASWTAAARRPAEPAAAAHSGSAVAQAAAASSSFMTQVSRDASTRGSGTHHAASAAPATHGHTSALSSPSHLAAHYSKKHSLRLSRPIGRQPSRSQLPPTHLDRRILLVLDMDETLLHASINPTASCHARFTVKMDRQTVDVYVNFRPYVQQFLQACARHFEVAVFTASISDYANQVLDHMDPDGRLIHHRLFRDHCTEVDGAYIKDLSLLGRPTNRVAIVDNSPTAYSFHPENAIPIESWFDDQNDRELLKLLPSLEALSRQACVFEQLARYQRGQS